MPIIRSAHAASVKQPVRFYKFVALTFLCVTVALFGIILFVSSKRAKITIVTKSEPTETSFTVGVGGAEDTAVTGMVIATNVTINKIFAPQGVKKEESVAQGTVTLFNESAISQPLVATTRLLTSNDVLFRLKKAVTVPAHGSIDAEVYADKGGSASEIGPSSFTIPGLNEARQKQVYARSTAKMVGGVRDIGVITGEDIGNAEKAALEEAKKNAGEAFLKDHPDLKGVVAAGEYSLKPDHEVGVEASSFTLQGAATIVGVLYNPQELLTYANSMLQKHIVADSEVLKSTEAEPVVSLESYNLETKSAVLNVSQSGRVSLDANSKDLKKELFFGKSQDDVRRYALSLPHVEGALVEFRPIWNRTVPHSADHVDIVVREGE